MLEILEPETAWNRLELFYSKQLVSVGWKPLDVQIRWVHGVGQHRSEALHTRHLSQVQQVKRAVPAGIPHLNLLANMCLHINQWKLLK